MNILLHICCAPCAIFPVERFRRDGHGFKGFFYNPNIHPYSEYLKRKGEAEKHSKEGGFAVVCPEYDMESYFRHVAYDEAPGKRCPACWRLRMDSSARFAKENGFDAFSTTLLGSPYQDHGVIKKIGGEVAGRYGIGFHYEDFRAGFRQAHKAAKARGVYCQNYCGCLFSEKERIELKAESSKLKAQK